MRLEVRQKTQDLFWRDITSMGSSAFYALLVGVSFLAGLELLFLRLALGYLLIYGAAVLIRSFYFKKRPDNESYEGWWQKVNASSFPSIHAARATFLSMAFAWHFKSLEIALLLAFFAVLVMQSRVALKRHDRFDVFAGQLLGVAVAVLA